MARNDPVVEVPVDDGTKTQETSAEPQPSGPVTIGTFLDKSYPDMVDIQREMFKSKYGTQIMGDVEWTGIVKRELSQRIV